MSEDGEEGSEELSFEMGLTSVAPLVTAVLASASLLLQASCPGYAAVLLRVIVPESTTPLKGSIPSGGGAVHAELPQATLEMQAECLACMGAIAVHTLRLALGH